MYETVFVRTIRAGRVKGFWLGIKGTVIIVFIPFGSGVGIIEWRVTAYYQGCGQKNDRGLFHSGTG
jgi:hypothetical protein